MDREAIWRFIERFTTLAAGTSVFAMLALADRTGMLKAMAGAGPLTASALAGRAGLEERYVREILSGLAAGRVVDYDPDSDAFSLPDAHAACLADEESPYSMLGWLDLLPEGISHLDQLERAAREGGGVALADYSERAVAGVDRANAPSMTHLLTRKWLTAMPDVVERLSEGGTIADVGCGSGAAVAAMARAFPRSTVWGFDVDPRALGRAEERVRGLDNVRLEREDAARIPADVGFDLVTAFDVVHDLPRPLESLVRIRESLAPQGVFFMMEPRASSRLEDNLDDRGALLYGVSTLACMPQSLEAGGEGLGTAWGRERAEQTCLEAGFGRFEELPIENPFSAFYRVEP